MAGLVVLSACGGTSVASSPASVVKDLFAAFQANNCDRVFALQTKALDNDEGGKAKVCEGAAQLAIRYRANTFRVDRVERHGNRADVFATRTNPDGTTRTATLGAKVEDGRWKVNSIARTSPTSTVPASAVSPSTASTRTTR
jgi:hypothetical protein